MSLDDSGSFEYFPDNIGASILSDDYFCKNKANWNQGYSVNQYAGFVRVYDSRIDFDWTSSDNLGLLSYVFQKRIELELKEKVFDEEYQERLSVLRNNITPLNELIRARNVFTRESLLVYFSNKLAQRTLGTDLTVEVKFVDSSLLDERLKLVKCKEREDIIRVEQEGLEASRVEQQRGSLEDEEYLAYLEGEVGSNLKLELLESLSAEFKNRLIDLCVDLKRKEVGDCQLQDGVKENDEDLFQVLDEEDEQDYLQIKKGLIEEIDLNMVIDNLGLEDKKLALLVLKEIIDQQVKGRELNEKFFSFNPKRGDMKNQIFDLLTLSK
jgi:hypothetical protein